MATTLIVSRTRNPRQLRGADGTLLTTPAGWVLLPPGDAALTRRVKATGPSWAVVEKKGRNTFSHGLWAPAATIEAVCQALALERADPTYASRLESAARRREATPAASV